MSATECPKCKAEMFFPVGDRSARQRMRCDFCGYEMVYLAHFISDEEHRSTAEASRRVTVFIVWKEGRPTAAEIVNLRHIITSLRDTPLADIQDMFGDSDRHCLGEFELWKARGIQEKALKYDENIEWSDEQ